MPTIVSRDEMVELLRQEFAAISDVGEGLDAASWDSPTCLPGWTVKDLLSHMVGTERMLLGEPAPAVDTSHLTHMQNPPAVANEAWVESMRALPVAAVLDQWREVSAKRLAALDGMTQADFDAPSWTPAGPDETYGRFMQIRHYDCYLHELDLREAAGLADRADPAQVSAALREPVAALGYIAGKKARLPAGTTARIRLTGPVEAEHLIEVGDRAKVVDRLDGDPTAGIVLDALLFLRLSGGRRDAAPHLGQEVRLEGDESLARQLATNLAYTI